MTRRAFGATSADFKTDERGNVASGGVGHVYRDQEKTLPVTDLLDVDGTPISTVYAKTSPKGQVQFQGPDDGTVVLWLDFGAGPVKMVASDGVVAAENVPDLSASYATQAQRTTLAAADATHAALTAAHGATGAIVGTTNTQTLTGKTVALGSNTVSGTRAQFNTAMTDDDFATLTGSETLTNKTLTAPAMTAPTASGDLSGFGGAWTAYTPTLVNIPATITQARFKQIGKLIVARIELTLTGAPTGAFTVSLPAASIALVGGGGTQAIGSAGGLRVAVGVKASTVMLASTTTVNFVDNGTGTTWAVAAPFAWASGDSLGFSVQYEAA